MHCRFKFIILRQDTALKTLFFQALYFIDSISICIYTFLISNTHLYINKMVGLIQICVQEMYTNGAYLITLITCILENF